MPDIVIVVIVATAEVTPLSQDHAVSQHQVEPSSQVPPPTVVNGEDIHLFLHFLSPIQILVQRLG